LDALFYQKLLTDASLSSDMVCFIGFCRNIAGLLRCW